MKTKTETKNDMVKCSHCQGTGEVELTGLCADTLALLRSQGEIEISGADLAQKAGCGATLMNNRLASLEKMGLVRSRRYGRLRLYRSENMNK